VARSTNGVFTAANVGKFAYDGGHMQKHASLPSPGMNLGPMANDALTTEIRRVLGTDIGLSYTQPQLAGGIRSSAVDYAAFLRRILRNELRISALLGSNATCTNPATCPTAINTPIDGGVNWHYSVGHWVEDDPASGDGSFSSAGAFGFYPWINASKTLYGVVARVGLAGAGEASAQCGAIIRKAWVTGTAQ
jgi:CubicO group peptidase (beta-lactamase class C family)